MFEKSVSYQYVSNVTKGAVTSVSGLTDGMVAIVNTAGTVLTALAAADLPIRIAQNVGGQIILSPVFTRGKLLKGTSAAYAAATEQISLFGSASATGLGTIVAGDTYTLSLVLTYSQSAVNNTPFIKTIPYRATGATQEEVATGLTLAAEGILKRNMPQPIVQVTRVSNGTQADWSGAATHILVTNGSRAVIFTNGSAVPANGEAFSDGQILGIAGTTYKVVGTGTVDGFVLDQEYKGATAEVAGGTTYATQAGKLSTVTLWALRFTGVKQPFDPVTSMYHKVRFSITSSGFGANVPQSTTQNAYEGNGTYEQIAQREIYAAMNDGNVVVQSYPPTNYRKAAVAGYTYDILNMVALEDKFIAEGSGINPRQTITLDIAIRSSLTYEDFKTVLGIA
jgi:hypothetical protein